jgi:biotin carboxyl carrier protein
MKYIATIEDEQYEIEIKTDGEITINGEPKSVDFKSIAGRPVYSLLLNGKSYEAHVSSSETGLDVLLRGQLYSVAVEDERQRRLRQASEAQVDVTGDLHIKAPMPGLIVSVHVQEGDQVEKGDNLIILESMKMQNEIKAPHAGNVIRVAVRAGDNVDQNQIMVGLH